MNAYLHLVVSHQVSCQSLIDMLKAPWAATAALALNHGTVVSSTVVSHINSRTDAEWHHHLGR